jgi:hypothetical protein
MMVRLYPLKLAGVHGDRWTVRQDTGFWHLSL